MPMAKGFYLSYASLTFDGHKDFTRQEAEKFVQAHYQGIKPGSRDYVFQPMHDSWLLSGVSPLGSRAVVSMAKGLRLTPNRLDVTMDIPLSEFRFPPEAGPYRDICEKAKVWFKKNRPSVAFAENAQMRGMSRTTFGSRTSRWLLTITDFIIGGSEGIGITFQLRQDRVESGWEWLAGLPTSKDNEMETACEELFSACTNTLLGPDFFGVGNSTKPYLLTKKRTVEKRDWYATLSAFANKVVMEELTAEDGITCKMSLDFLEKEIAKRLQDKLKSVTIGSGLSNDVGSTSAK